MNISQWVWVVLKRTVGFNVSSDRLLESCLQKTVRAYWSNCCVVTNGSFQSILIELLCCNQRFFSEHTDRNDELKLTVRFRTIPTHFRDSQYMVLPQTFPYRIPQCKVLNPTQFIVYILLKVFDQVFQGNSLKDHFTLEDHLNTAQIVHYYN